MDFSMNEEQRMAVDGLRKFLDNEIEPQLKVYQDQHIPKDAMRTFIKKLINFGLVVAPHPEEHGGMGLDWLIHLMLFEEVAYTSSDLAVPIILNSCGADMLLAIAPDHILDRYLPGLMSGDLFLASGFSEPDVGSDPSGIKARAKREGDHWVINAEKTWISNGTYSDFFICTCLTDAGLSHILVDREEHGYEAVDIPKIGLNGQSTAQVFLRDTQVPIANLLGEEGKGLENTLRAFERPRLHIAAWCIGVARRAMDESIKYAQDRVQHGKPIAGHQLIAEKIASMATEIDAARLLLHRAAALNADETVRADKEASMAKWFANEMALRVTRDAMQIHGGNGLTKEFPVERLHREILVSQMPDGTTEIHKLMISRALTGISAIR